MSIRARDVIIGFLVCGLISLGMFQLISGMTSEYTVAATDPTIENALQDNQDVIDTVDSLTEDLEESDTVLESIYIVVFKGFKTVVLAIWSVGTSIFALLYTVGDYFGVGQYVAYISVLIAVTIIFTIWRALQGREGV